MQVRAVTALVAVASAFVLVPCGNAAAAAHSSKSQATIITCVNKRTGAMRLLTSRKRCKRSERRVAWGAAATGPKGDTGAPGGSKDWLFSVADSPQMGGSAGWFGVASLALPYAGQYAITGVITPSCQFNGSTEGLPAGTYGGMSTEMLIGILRPGSGNVYSAYLGTVVCGEPFTFVWAQEQHGGSIDLLAGDVVYVQARDARSLMYGAGDNTFLSVSLIGHQISTAIGAGS